MLLPMEGSFAVMADGASVPVGVPLASNIVGTPLCEMLGPMDGTSDGTLVAIPKGASVRVGEPLGWEMGASVFTWNGFKVELMLVGTESCFVGMAVLAKMGSKGSKGARVEPAVGIQLDGISLLGFVVGALWVLLLGSGTLVVGRVGSGRGGIRVEMDGGGIDTTGALITGCAVVPIIQTGLGTGLLLSLSSVLKDGAKAMGCISTFDDDDDGEKLFRGLSDGILLDEGTNVSGPWTQFFLGLGPTWLLETNHR
jgi:hypothetical protein